MMYGSGVNDPNQNGMAGMGLNQTNPGMPTGPMSANVGQFEISQYQPQVMPQFEVSQYQPQVTPQTNQMMGYQPGPSMGNQSMGGGGYQAMTPQQPMTLPPMTLPQQGFPSPSGGVQQQPFTGMQQQPMTLPPPQMANQQPQMRQGLPPMQGGGQLPMQLPTGPGMGRFGGGRAGWRGRGLFGRG